MAFGLVVPTDVELLGGLFAFGATIAFTIAHVVDHPAADRPSRTARGRSGSRSTSRSAARGCRCRRWSRRCSPALAWVSVIVYHDSARWVGGGWMVFGLVGYVIYRKGVEGTTLTERVEVPAEALVKDGAGASTATSSCRSSGPSSTTTSSARPGGSPTPPIEPGELAAAARGDLRRSTLPLTVPLDAPPPHERDGGRERGARARAGRSARSTRRSRCTLGGPGALGRRRDRRRRRASAAWR